MDYEKKYKEALERMKSWAKGEHPECFSEAQKTAEFIFPELKENEDEKIKREIVAYINELADLKNEKIPTKWLDWLEKQGNKSVNIDVESMVSSYEQRLESQGGTKYTPLVNMCLTAFRHGVENVLEELNLKKLEKQDKENNTYTINNTPNYGISVHNEELKESKDERIRKTIYGWIHTQPSEFFDNGFSKEEMLAWVDKQADKDKLIRELGEYKVKYTQKVLQEDLNKNTEPQSQPKFKVRDWIVDDVGYYWRVTKVLPNYYELEGDDGVESTPTIKWTDEKFHLWTIDDAKKGDILVVDGVWIVEFDKKMTDDCSWRDASILTSVVYDMDDDICTLGSHMFYKEIWPASKEDIDLFKKKKNEYLAINAHNEPKFKVGDKV